MLAALDVQPDTSLTRKPREKVKRYKAAAEERRATFCPLIVTVEGIAHQSMQAFLRRIAARLSAKWQNPPSTVSNWVRVRKQFALIKAVDLQTGGSRKNWWRSSGFEDGEGIAVLRCFVLIWVLGFHV